MSWPLVRLDSLYDIARGGSPRPIKDYITEDSNGINWVKISDATASGKYIYETKQKIKPEGIQRSRLVNEGDFLLSNSMSFGRPYIMATSGCIHDGWLVLSAKGDHIDKDFLYYMLGSPFVFNQFDSLAAGSTVRNLNIDLVSGVKIPLLPISEQKRIVTLLDTTFTDLEQTRAKTEQNLKNARELFDSSLKRIFESKGENWERISLLELLERKYITSHLDGNHGGAYPRKNEFIESGVPYISAKCLVGGKVDMNKAKYLSVERAGTLRKGIAKNEDVLFAHNATVGPVSILETTEDKVILGTSLTYYRCNKKYILPKYLAQYMISYEFTSQYKSIMRQSTRNQVPITKQRTFIHIIPPIDEQEKIAESLAVLSEELNKLELIYTEKLSAIDELKNSILQKAFNGELITTTK